MGSSHSAPRRPGSALRRNRGRNNNRNNSERNNSTAESIDEHQPSFFFEESGEFSGPLEFSASLHLGPESSSGANETLIDPFSSSSATRGTRTTETAPSRSPGRRQRPRHNANNASRSGGNQRHIDLLDLSPDYRVQRLEVIRSSRSLRPEHSDEEAETNSNSAGPAATSTSDEEQSSASAAAAPMEPTESFTTPPTYIPAITDTNSPPVYMPSSYQQQIMEHESSDSPYQAPAWGPPVLMAPDGAGPFQGAVVGPPSEPKQEFFPQVSRHQEWMGRSLETLLLGYTSVAPILCLPDDEDDMGSAYETVWGAIRRRSTVSTLGSDLGRRSSLGSRRGSLAGSLGGRSNMHGGTLANYYRRRGTGATAGTGSASGSGSGSGGEPHPPPPVNRRGSAIGGTANRRGSVTVGSGGLSYRRRLSMSTSGDGEERPGTGHGGPNIALSLLARESTGRLHSRNVLPAA